jgi:hypothetical protein
VTTTGRPAESSTPRSTAIVHIGTHRTGTTSFQDWAHRSRDELAARAQIYYYDGLFGLSHYELPILCMRRNRSMPMRTVVPDWCLDEWQTDVRAHIRQQVRAPMRTLLCSAEGLSYLRHQDEIERLVELLEPRLVSVVVVLRNPRDFLASYTAMLARQGFSPSRYHESFSYVQDDTWLVRYDELVGAYRNVIGADRVHVVPYDDHVGRDGSIIPAVLGACGADIERLPAWDRPWKNRSQVPASGMSRRQRLVRRTRKALRRLRR